ncbi:MAG: LTA synthase family protein [Eubacteriaceae bacterium]|jgi:phosphoglycerol transferase MdoB-like AlkP superfamily enzyme|nr:LTA synthase family protein [Eubacteriaceae bacterium]
MKKRAAGKKKTIYTAEQVSLRRYFQMHWRRVVCVLIISLAAAALFTARTLASQPDLFAGNPLFGTLTERTSHIAGALGQNTATNYADLLMNAVWGFIFLWLPVFFVTGWLSMFAAVPQRTAPARAKYAAAARTAAGIVLFACVLMRYGGPPDIAVQDYFDGIRGAFIQWTAAWLILAAAVTDYKKFRRWRRRRVLDRYQWFVKPAVIILVSVLCFFVLEYQCGSKTNVIENMKGFNISYWIILQLFFYIIFRSVKPGAVISIAAAWFIGFANYVVMQFRGNYIMFGDLTVVRTALRVADNYKLTLDKYFYISLAVSAAGIILVLMMRNVHTVPAEGPARRVITSAILECVLVAAVIFLFSTGLLYGKIFGVAWDYNTNVTYNGYLPYFMSNANSINNVEAEGYSAAGAESAIEQGAARYDKKHGKTSSAKTEPNIIIIQNEAFSDLAVTADIKTNIDYMPFIHSLKKNTQKGYMNLSITGGPTANSEFETLTQSTMAFMPYGSVPFTQYLKSAVPDIVTTLESQNKKYETVGFHPYYSSGYTRRSVYSLLGFDKTVFYDKTSDTRGKEKIRGMVSDSQDYRDIEKMYEKNKSESSSPLFIFNVTIQNHGGYTKNTYDFTEPVHVTNFAATDSINTYLSLIRESDKAFRELTEYYSQQKEPTIILMYGDHQPSFDDTAKRQLALHPAWDSTELQTLSKYYVPYVMWANYDIAEKDDMRSGGTSASLNNISLEFAAPVLFENAGLSLSDYEKYLLDLHDRVPALTAQGYWTKSGRHYAVDDSDSNDYRYIEQYRKVQYNLLFDKKNKLTSSYSPK